MSALGGSALVRSPAEIASGGDGNRERLGGVVVSLRNEQLVAGPLEQPGSLASELGPISPELALVDPELGRAARALLPDLPRMTPVRSYVTPLPVAEQPAAVERLRSGLEPTSKLAFRRRRVQLGLLSPLTGLVALGVLLALVVGREQDPAPPQQQTQPVAAVLSPPDAPPAQPSSTSPTPSTQSKPATTKGSKPATPPAASTPAHASSPAATPHRTRTRPAPSTAPQTPAPPGQTFVWVAAPKAAGYEFQLFQGGERVFRARVDKPRLELPGRWRQGGRAHTLAPGNYRWYVWTVSSTKRQSAVAIVQAKLVIAKQPN